MNGKPILNWGDFSRGLWLLGPKDGNPPGTLRRAKGVHPVRDRQLRTRDGHGAIASGFDGTLNSIAYFAGSYWVGTSTGKLYRVETDGTMELIKEGFDGTPLRFLVQPPAGGLADWLFVSGGGTGVGLIKIDKEGNVKPWGITAPPDGFTVEALPPRQKTITTFTDFFNPNNNNPLLTVWASVEIPRGGEVTLSAPSSDDPGYDPSALKATSKPSRLAWIRRKFVTPIDLTMFDASDYDKFPGSSDLDYICLRVWVDLPNFIDFVQIGLDLGTGADANNFTTDFYTATVSVKPKSNLTAEQGDIRSLSELLTERIRELTIAAEDGVETVNARRVAVRRTKGEAEILPFFAPTQIEVAAQAWTDIRIPKARFYRSGVDEDKDFSSVTAAAIYFHTRQVDPETGQNLGNNDLITVYFKDFRLEGGYGTKGPTYFHQITYRDSETGNRSNPNPTPVATPRSTTGKPQDSIDRNPFKLKKLPVDGAPVGADQIEEWRSLGDGSDLFLAKREFISEVEGQREDLGLEARESFDGVPDIYDFNRRDPIPADGLVVSLVTDATQVTFTDVIQGGKIQVGDQIIVEEEIYNVIAKIGTIIAKVDRATAFGGGLAFEWLGGVTELGALDPVSLPLDNIAPQRDFEDCIIIHGRAVWISGREKQRGRVFYSPEGRPEAANDFVEISNDQEETQRLIEWNGLAWVFTQGGVYEFDLRVEPFILRRVAGAPGTMQPDTVVRTRLGIIYQARDNIMLFDGTDSQPIDEGLVPIIQGETKEGIAAFEGVYAAQDEHEYFITDGTTSLAFDLFNRRWREVGTGFGALAYVPELQRTVGGLSDALVEVEQEGTTADAGEAIALDWELPSAQVENGERALIRRVNLDIDTGGQRIAVTLIADNEEISLAPIKTDAREIVELALSREVKRLGLRLSGSVSVPVELYDVDVDGRVIGGVG